MTTPTSPIPALYKATLDGQNGLVVEQKRLTITCPKCSANLDVTGFGLGNHAACHCGNTTYIPNLRLGRTKAALALAGSFALGLAVNWVYDAIKGATAKEESSVGLNHEGLDGSQKEKTK